MEENNYKSPIRSFRDLEVYRNSYAAMLVVMKDIIPLLPESEKKDFADQLSRSCKVIPRLIAEGYAKRHQKAGFQKYIDDAMAESNETIVSLEQSKDIYNIKPEVIAELVVIYDRTGRQLYRLAEKWSTFKLNRSNESPESPNPNPLTTPAS